MKKKLIGVWLIVLAVISVKGCNLANAVKADGGVALITCMAWIGICNILKYARY